MGQGAVLPDPLLNFISHTESSAPLGVAALLKSPP
jgi:hypothetical protein